jgi:hypothetical protein
MILGSHLRKNHIQPTQIYMVERSKVEALFSRSILRTGRRGPARRRRSICALTRRFMYRFNNQSRSTVTRLVQRYSYHIHRQDEFLEAEVAIKGAMWRGSADGVIDSDFAAP